LYNRQFDSPYVAGRNWTFLKELFKGGIPTANFRGSGELIERKVGVGTICIGGTYAQRPENWA
jgi:hypothetical protein